MRSYRKGLSLAIKSPRDLKSTSSQLGHSCGYGQAKSIQLVHMLPQAASPRILPGAPSSVASSSLSSSSSVSLSESSTLQFSSGGRAVPLCADRQSAMWCGTPFTSTVCSDKTTVTRPVGHWVVQRAEAGFTNTTSQRENVCCCLKVALSPESLRWNCATRSYN